MDKLLDENVSVNVCFIVEPNLLCLRHLNSLAIQKFCTVCIFYVWCCHLVVEQENKLNNEM